jgi:transposase
MAPATPLCSRAPGTVYHYFRAWKDAGVLAELQRALHEQARLSRGRLPCLSVVILDSQPVKTTERGSPRGFDGHKRVKGRKRHLLVDTLGMVVARRVEAANVSDRRVGARLLAGLQSGFPSIRTVMADAGYESGKLACELKRRHGWRLHITKRRQRAFKVVGLTWIVERTFAWLARNRRLSKDYELKGPNFGSLYRPGGHPPHARTARPEVKLLKHPLKPENHSLNESYIYTYIYRKLHQNPHGIAPGFEGPRPAFGRPTTKGHTNGVRDIQGLLLDRTRLAKQSKARKFSLSG